MAVFHKHNRTRHVRPLATRLLAVQDPSLLLLLLQKLPDAILQLYPQASEVEPEFKKALLARLKDAWTSLRKPAWRRFHELINVIPLLQCYFELDEYNEHFLAEMVDVIKASNLPVQTAASKACCDLLLHNYHSSKREDCIAKLVGLGQSKSCYERLSYLTFSVCAIRNMPFNLLKRTQVIETMLALAADPIANLRFRFVKAALQILPRSLQSVQRCLVEKLRDLCNDKNAEVKKQALKVVPQVQRLIEENAKCEDEIADLEEQKLAREQELLSHVNLFTTFVGRGAEIPLDLAQRSCSAQENRQTCPRQNHSQTLLET